VTVSKQVAHEVERGYRLKVHMVIPNAVDTEVFHPGPSQRPGKWNFSQDRAYALFVGRMEAGKQPNLAAEACEAAGWNLVTAGQGVPPSGALHLGLLPADELAELYRDVDAVVLPTLYEGCSFVCIEALASRVPLVTSLVGWIPTLLEAVPEYEVLIGPPDPADIARRLQLIALEPLDELLERARAFVVDECSLRTFSARWAAALGLALPEQHQPT
jgi:glycosyltransferase involved in cell wall biosynthesis